MRPHGRIRRSAKVSSSWRGASDRRSSCLTCAARIALDSKAGLLRTSASMKQNHSASGAAALAPIQQACDLPIQRGGSGGDGLTATRTSRAAMPRTMATVASAE